MRVLAGQYGFSGGKDIVVMLDSGTVPMHLNPTYDNIVRGLLSLISGVLF